MWDFSKPFAAASKWRRVTAGQRAQQSRTGDTLRREAAVLEAGGTVPVPKRRRRGSAPKPAAPIDPAEATALRAFLGVHGRDIAVLLARAEGEPQQLALARGYRAILNGEPGAHAAWGRLLASLGL